MNILLCEGKNDAWFFDELMNVRFKNRKHTIYDDNLPKLQEMCGSRCYNHTNKTFPLIIYGDGGKTEILKVLRRLITEIIDTNNVIIMVRDEDYAPQEELNKKFLEELECIIKANSRFTHIPPLERNKNLFILHHPKSGGLLKLGLSIVPRSLEKQVVNKTVEHKCPCESKILEKDPHEALELLASEYYDGDRQQLIRESSTWLRDETWVNQIESLVN